MQDLLEGLGKLLQDFSIRRAIGLLLLILLVYLGVVVYERATNTLALSRIERLAKLEEQLARLDGTAVSADPALKQVHARLKAELAAAATTRAPILSVPSSIVPDLPTGIKRYLSGAAIWIRLALGVASSRTESEQPKRPAVVVRKRSTFATRGERAHTANQAGAVSFLAGSVSVMLPLREEWWFLWLAYPLVTLVVGLGIVGILELGSPMPNEGDNSPPSDSAV